MAKIRQIGKKQKRKLRVRNKIIGTKERPRLSVFRSNKYIYGQLIDDVNGQTLVDIQAEAKKLHEKKGLSKKEGAFETGKALAEKAKEAKIKSVVFDRGSYKYHGRVKSFADGAREGGLNF